MPVAFHNRNANVPALRMSREVIEGANDMLFLPGSGPFVLGLTLQLPPFPGLTLTILETD